MISALVFMLLGLLAMAGFAILLWELAKYGLRCLWRRFRKWDNDLGSPPH